MFINKSENGLNNIIGQQLKSRRKMKHVSQRQFAELLQLQGLEIEKNAIQRIEAGKRFVTDIELICICKALNTTPNELLQYN